MKEHSPARHFTQNRSSQTSPSQTYVLPVRHGLQHYGDH